MADTVAFNGEIEILLVWNDETLAWSHEYSWCGCDPEPRQAISE